MHGILEQAFGGEVLSENGKRKVAAGKLHLPEGIVFDGIAVHRFIFAAVNSEVGLTVAIEIQLAESDAARDRLLEDAGGDHSVVPGDFPREADVEGDELHGLKRIGCGSCGKDTRRKRKLEKRKGKM